MATKRKPLRRRHIGSEAELSAWSDVFTCEFDFFNDLEPFGLLTDAEVKAAAPEAWKRLGGAFLASWKPTETRDTPWALQEFGAP